MSAAHIGHTAVVTTPPLPSRRERQRATTRDALATAALELFEERGFAATTIDDIAERADVARRTFFRYFATKEAVLFPDPADYRPEMLAVLDRIQAPVAMSQILDAFTAAAVTMEAEVEIHRRRTAVIASNRLDVVDAAVGAFLAARDTIIDHLTERNAPAALDPRLQLGVSLALFALAQGFVRWAEGEVDGTLVEVLADTFETVRGLMADQIVMGEYPGA